MTWLRWVVAVAALLVVVRPASANDRVRATALVQQGTEQFTAHDYAAALRAFQQAYAAYASPKVLFNIGRAAAEMHEDVLAANAFNAFVDQTNDAPEVRAQLNFARDQLDKRKAKLGLFTFQVLPLDATVLVDGQPAFDSSWYLAPGTHEVRVSAAGYSPFVDRFEIHSTERRKIPVVLQRVAVAAAPAPAQKANLAPPAVSSTPAAAVVDALETRGRQSSHARRDAGWALVGTGGAALAVSAVFGAMAASRNATLDALVSGEATDAMPSEAAGLRSAVARDAWISTATLGVGVVAAAVGTYLLLTQTAATAEPTADPRGMPALALRF